MREVPATGSRLLFQKRRTFSGIFLVFLESSKKFFDFEKKDHLQSLSISEILHPEKFGFFDARKLLF